MTETDAQNQPQASTGEEVPLIKDWKDILSKVSVPNLVKIPVACSIYVPRFKVSWFDYTIDLGQMMLFPIYFRQSICAKNKIPTFLYK
jgi:hypothetical protein